MLPILHTHIYTQIDTDAHTHSLTEFNHPATFIECPINTVLLNSSEYFIRKGRQVHTREAEIHEQGTAWALVPPRPLDKLGKLTGPWFLICNTVVIIELPYIFLWEFLWEFQ